MKRKLSQKEANFLKELEELLSRNDAAVTVLGDRVSFFIDNIEEGDCVPVESYVNAASLSRLIKKRKVRLNWKQPEQYDAKAKPEEFFLKNVTVANSGNIGCRGTMSYTPWNSAKVTPYCDLRQGICAELKSLSQNGIVALGSNKPEVISPAKLLDWIDQHGTDKVLRDLFAGRWVLDAPLPKEVTYSYFDFQEMVGQLHSSVARLTKRCTPIGVFSPGIY